MYTPPNMYSSTSVNLCIKKVNFALISEDLSTQKKRPWRPKYSVNIKVMKPWGSALNNEFFFNDKELSTQYELYNCCWLLISPVCSDMPTSLWFLAQGYISRVCQSMKWSEEKMSHPLKQDWLFGSVISKEESEFNVGRGASSGRMSPQGARFEDQEQTLPKQLATLQNEQGLLIVSLIFIQRWPDENKRSKVLKMIWSKSWIAAHTHTHTTKVYI